MKFRDLSLWGVVALVLGLMVSTPGRAADPPVMKFIPHPCAGAIDLPSVGMKLTVSGLSDKKVSVLKQVR